MKVDINEIKVLMITNNKERRTSIKIKDQTVEQIDNVKYL